MTKEVYSEETVRVCMHDVVYACEKHGIEVKDMPELFRRMNELIKVSMYIHRPIKSPPVKHFIVTQKKGEIFKK